MKQGIRRLTLFAAIAVSACGDDGPAGPNPNTGTTDEIVVVVNSTENSVSIITTGDTNLVSKIEIPGEDATPVSIAVRDSMAIVPLGLAHAAAVLNLRAETVTRVVALEAGSGATGAVFENDSIAWVANPGLNTVTRINILTGDTASVAVGKFPSAVVSTRGFIWVVNANLESFVPAGNSWLTVIDPANLTVVDSVGLSGVNAENAETGGDGLIYVVNSGNFGSGNGTLSIVDPDARTELDLLDGLGEFPGALFWSSLDVAFIASFAEGIMEISPRSRRITRGVGNGIMPEGAGVPGVVADSRGLIYALNSTDCVSPGRVNVLSPLDFGILRTVEAGSCPFAIEVTRISR